MKRAQLNSLNNSIIELINDKVEINGSLCGLPLKFEVRKKAHQILKKLAEAEYTNLDTNNGIDINEEIFRVVAKKLNLILII